MVTVGSGFFVTDSLRSWNWILSLSTSSNTTCLFRKPLMRPFMVRELQAGRRLSPNLPVEIPGKKTGDSVLSCKTYCMRVTGKYVA